MKTDYIVYKFSHLDSVYSPRNHTGIFYKDINTDYVLMNDGEFKEEFGTISEMKEYLKARKLTLIYGTLED